MATNEIATAVLSALGEITAKLTEIEAQNTLKTKPFLRVSDVAKLMGWKPQTIYEKVRKGDIPCYQPDGKTLYFKYDEIVQYVEKSRIKSNAEIEEIVKKNY